MATSHGAPARLLLHALHVCLFHLSLSSAFVPLQLPAQLPQQQCAWRICGAPPLHVDGAKCYSHRRRRAVRTAAERLGETSRPQQPPASGVSEEETQVLIELDYETVYSEVGMRRTLDSLENAASSAAARRRDEERRAAELEQERQDMLRRSASRNAAASTGAGGSNASAATTRSPCPLGSIADALRGQRPGGGDPLAAAGSDAATGSQSQAAGYNTATSSFAADSAAASAAAAAGADGSFGRDDAAGAAETAKKRRRVPLPLFDVPSVGLLGRWEEMGGNLLVRPPADVPPVAVVHFLGGAFVGAAPHLSYNYLLTGLADAGFIVVATPYPLGFDYLAVCDGILERFERAAVPLAKEYGALPVVGVGHSAGALLQLLITCLFPDTPRAANALLSFNNKPIEEAVPLFEEVVLPLATQLLAEGSGAAALGETLQALRESALNLADTVARSELAPAVVEGEVLPLLRQTLQVIDQFPPLFRALAEGTREFTPTPEETKEVARRMYRARRTLLVQFENDSIDETPGIKEVIQEGKTLLRMRRPMVDMDLRYELITGNHITPLTQDLFLPSTPLDAVDPLLGVRQSVRADFLKTVDQLGRLLVEWLNEAVKPTSYVPR